MPQQNAAARSKPSGPTCLVIEDSLFDQERIRRILNKSFKNVSAVFASTIEEARQHMAKQRTTIILLDNNLPDGTGANFALELSDDPNFSTIPIVMVSDWPTPFMFDKAQSAGVIHVVNKSDFGARYIHSALSHNVRPKRIN